MTVPRGHWADITGGPKLPQHAYRLSGSDMKIMCTSTIIACDEWAQPSMTNGLKVFGVRWPIGPVANLPVGYRKRYINAFINKS